jgi:hypothetical protein
MPQFRVQIPFLVWYECDVEANDEKEAFEKVALRQNDYEVNIYNGNYDEEELSPETVSWQVHSVDEDGDENYQPTEFSKTPEEKR